MSGTDKSHATLLDELASPAAAVWGGRSSAECGRDVRRGARRSGHGVHAPDACLHARLRL